MRILRNNLITMFGAFPPERLISDLYFRLCCGKTEITGNYIPDLVTYRSFALEYFKNLTYEEVDALYYNMCGTIKKRGALCGGESVFVLLPEYTLHVLYMDSSIPVCRQNERLNWRSCYLQLGQDILTAAHLSYLSINDNRDFNYFGWPSVIGTDDRRLTEILNKGLAENHFHLNGSTRGFDLSWICLMNHPHRISGFFALKGKSKNENVMNNTFEENLYASSSMGVSDNRMSWKQKLFCACWLRVKLFMWLQEQSSPFAHSDSADKNPVKCFLDMVKKIEVASSTEFEALTDSAKFIYGRHGKFKQENGKKVIFDYAVISTEMHNNSPCRSLSGERKFLYDAFRAVFSGKANAWPGFADLLYLYILIKTQFRHEIIQSNDRYGFKNFSMYQDRKDRIFDDFPEYKLEAKNLSVNDGIIKKRIDSLEVRIVPQKTYAEQENKIHATDDSILFLQNKTTPKLPKDRKAKGLKYKWFYVLHFPKLPEKNKLKREFAFLNRPRNAKLRANSMLQAFSVARAIERYNWLSARIRGIDACTFEIGCRPEIFAAEFRFLRNFVCTELSEARNYSSDILQPNICATYHVGEDFLDIVDGLRAIDEALLFLEMKPGERLGHALALGVDVSDYYKLKNYWIILTKQDYLDNIVWALNKAKALNIDLPSSFKQKLHDKAEALIYEIYRLNIRVSDYYNGWMLRGDDPELYRFGFYDKKEYERGSDFPTNNITSQYNRCRILKFYHPWELSALREDPTAASLYSMYHFDSDAGARGGEFETIHITDDYVKMAANIQKGMQREIALRRIGIECNLSSNVLIGPFKLYEKHPIFTFYPVRSSGRELSQFVTINTDDQGVFDTSLEEEFALLECTLRSMRDHDQTPCYNDDEIYDYLERIRRNGFFQTFPRADHNYNNFPNNFRKE